MLISADLKQFLYIKFLLGIKYLLPAPRLHLLVYSITLSWRVSAQKRSGSNFPCCACRCQVFISWLQSFRFLCRYFNWRNSSVYCFERRERKIMITWRWNRAKQSKTRIIMRKVMEEKEQFTSCISAACFLSKFLVIYGHCSPSWLTWRQKALGDDENNALL